MVTHITYSILLGRSDESLLAISLCGAASLDVVKWVRAPLVDRNGTTVCPPGGQNAGRYYLSRALPQACVFIFTFIAQDLSPCAPSCCHGHFTGQEKLRQGGGSGGVATVGLWVPVRVTPYQPITHSVTPLSRLHSRSWPS